MAETIRVMLLEDHALLAQTVAAALTLDGFDVVRLEQFDGASVRAAAAQHRPDVVLLDLVLQDGATALPFIPFLVELGATVLLVTGETSRQRLAECVEAGAIGIIGKDEPFESLVVAIREVAELRTLLTTSQRDDLLAELRRQRAEDAARLAPFDRLTPREQQVLASLVYGRSPEVISKSEHSSHLDGAEPDPVDPLETRSELTAGRRRAGS